MINESNRLQKVIVAPLQHLLGHPHFVPLCFALFLAIRLIALFVIPSMEPFSDADWYFNRGITLAEKGTYSEGDIPTAYWPVGYPAFLALVFKIAGPSVLAGQLANLLLAAASFWLLYFVVRRMLDDEFVARCSVLLLAIYPNNAAYISALLTETLFTFLLLAACFCLLSRKHWLHIVIAGLLLGYATLVKTQTLLLIPLLAFVATLDKWSLRSWPRAIGYAAAVGAIAFAVVTPWMWRNHNVMGAAVLSTNGGTTFLASNNPSVVGDYWRDLSVDDPLYKQANFSVKDQVNADRRARALALEWIKANPGTYIGLVPKKLFRVWGMDGEGEWWYQDTKFYKEYKTWFRTVRVANQVFYLAILALFPFALWKLISRRASPPAYLGVALVFFITLICIIFSGQSRFHFPAMPFLFAYAAWVVLGSAPVRTSDTAK